jgi:hypothetical protein
MSRNIVWTAVASLALGVVSIVVALTTENIALTIATGLSAVASASLSSREK